MTVGYCQGLNVSRVVPALFSSEHVSELRSSLFPSDGRCNSLAHSSTRGRSVSPTRHPFASSRSTLTIVSSPQFLGLPLRRRAAHASELLLSGSSLYFPYLPLVHLAKKISTLKVRFAGSRADQRVLQDFVHQELPALDRHMSDHGIEITAVAFGWFLSLFTDCREFDFDSNPSRRVSLRADFSFVLRLAVPVEVRTSSS